MHCKHTRIAYDPNRGITINAKSWHMPDGQERIRADKFEGVIDPEFEKWYRRENDDLENTVCKSDTKIVPRNLHLFLIYF